MSLKLGTWKICLSGNNGELKITEVKGDGEFNGTLLIQGIGGAYAESPVVGIYNETSRAICFHLSRGAYSGSPLIFNGILFSDPSRPNPGQDIIWRISGTMDCSLVEFATNLGGNAKRRTFGWIAEIHEEL